MCNWILRFFEMILSHKLIDWFLTFDPPEQLVGTVFRFASLPDYWNKLGTAIETKTFWSQLSYKAEKTLTQQFFVNASQKLPTLKMISVTDVLYCYRKINKPWYERQPISLYKIPWCHVNQDKQIFITVEEKLMDWLCLEVEHLSNFLDFPP